MLVHLLHKEARGRASECLKWVYIDIGGSMPVASTGGKEYGYVVTDAYTLAVHKATAPQVGGDGRIEDDSSRRNMLGD